MKFRPVFALKIVILGISLFAPIHHSHGSASTQLFPSTAPLLGSGSSGEKRLSSELRAGIGTLHPSGTFKTPDGLDESSPNFGIQLRYFSGSWSGADLDFTNTFRRLSGVQGRSNPLHQSRRFQLEIPVRIFWSEGEFIAPFTGLSYEQGDHVNYNVDYDIGSRSWLQEMTAIPLGFQVRATVTSFALWLEAYALLGVKSRLYSPQLASHSFGNVNSPYGYGYKIQMEWAQFQSKDKVFPIYALRIEELVRNWKEGTLSEFQTSLVTGYRF